MNLIALPAFTDNCIWMRHDGMSAIVVDPGDSAPVIDALASLRLTLAGILVTHHQEGEVRVCCAHECTLSNLKLAHAVEPSNDNVPDAASESGTDVFPALRQ